MNKIVKPLIVVFTLASMYACKKEVITLENNEEPMEANESNWFTDTLDSRVKTLTEEEMAYMNSLPDYDPEELALALKKESEISSGERSMEVWGIGTGRTVWKWNGFNWAQPNAAARLSIVEVAKNGANSIWGIAWNNTVWKWNGSSWGQPNPAARLSKIAVHSPSIAFGIAGNGTLFITTNGGQNWATFTNFQNATWISSGAFTNIVSVTNTQGNLFKFNLFTNQFDLVTVPNTNSIYVHSSIFGGGIWAIDWTTRRIYRSLNYLNFTQPNSGAGAYQISTNDSHTAWALGAHRTVWRTTNAGASWSQPNSAARLDYISAAY